MVHTEYTTALNSLIKSKGFNKDIMAHEEFRKLGEKLTDLDMLLAHELAINFMDKNPEINTEYRYKLYCRPMKRLTRVQQKLANTGPDAAFKANSDIAAFCINVPIKEINKVGSKLIKQIVNKYNGYIFEKNSIIDPVTGALTDIVTYYFVYIPEYKYIMEFQVGHEFATYVFTRDSMLRDNPKCGVVNFRANDFYNHVKAAILAGKRLYSEPLYTEFLALWDHHGLPREQIDDKLIMWFLAEMCY